MALLNRETGELTFMDGLRLSPGLVMGEVAQRLDGRTDAIVRLESHAVAGGRLVPVCTVAGGALQSVALTISSVASRPMRKAERQRAFLFAGWIWRIPARKAWTACMSPVPSASCSYPRIPSPAVPKRASCTPRAD